MSDKYRWHDLLMDPKDLPTDDGSCIVSMYGKWNMTTFVHAQAFGSYDMYAGWILEGYKNMGRLDCERIIEAWREPEPFKRKDTDKLQIEIKYKPGMLPIVRVHNGEWFDLRAAKDYRIVKGDLIKIDLGVAMDLPKGYEAHIRPRSSTAEEFGLMMACSGIIDNRFHGDNDYWSFEGYAIRTTSIKKNDRICQFRIVREQPGDEEINLKTVGFLNNEDRGGFGSTGKR